MLTAAQMTEEVKMLTEGAQHLGTVELTSDLMLNTINNVPDFRELEENQGEFGLLGVSANALLGGALKVLDALRHLHEADGPK